MPRKKCVGVGANCSVLLKYMHPAKTISDKYPNTTARQRIENLVALRQETKIVKRKQQRVIVFRHDDFLEVEIYCVRRWVKVMVEGAPEHFFEGEDNNGNNTGGPEEGNAGAEEQLNEIDGHIFNASNCAEDIAMVRNQGLDVDCDNEPAPENLPEVGDAINLQNPPVQQWGWDGQCNRAVTAAQNHRPSIIGIHGVMLEVISYVSMFLIFFPKNYLENVVCKLTSDNCEAPLTFGEFLKYIGIWLLIVKNSSGNIDRKLFWSKKPVSRKQGAPIRLNDLMSGERFEEITSNLTFTRHQPPTFKDRFWEIRELISEFNKNMVEVFIAGWICCLDESMSIWTNRWTCPGWVFCPRKPHPFRNEYHTISCGLSGILFRMEMVEGKDRPPQLPRDPSNKKTINLLLRLCSTIKASAKVLVLDSGFCVLEGLIELKKIGVYAGALIKKWRYWPKYVPGDLIDTYFEGKEVGETDSLHGILGGVPYDIFCMKEPDYVMKIMSTYGSLTVKEGQKESERKYEKDGEPVSTKFKYCLPFSNHFDFRHVIDDHNNLRHSLPSIEETWTTHRWATRVFAFILAVVEVNCYLAFRYFVWGGEERKSLNEFRLGLAWALIENEYLKREEGGEEEEEQRNIRRRVVEHRLETAPKRSVKYDGKNWIKKGKLDYPQFTCRMAGCKKAVRTYCVCNVGEWLCKDCFVNHIVEQNT